MNSDLTVSFPIQGACRLTTGVQSFICFKMDQQSFSSTLRDAVAENMEAQLQYLSKDSRVLHYCRLPADIANAVWEKISCGNCKQERLAQKQQPFAGTLKSLTTTETIPCKDEMANQLVRVNCVSMAGASF